MVNVFRSKRFGQCTRGVIEMSDPENRCPCCSNPGDELPELGENLLACMELNCRVNEFERGRAVQ